MNLDITCRLVVSDINFDEITLPTLFKIFECDSNKGICKISLYNGGESLVYAVCDFTDKNAAKRAYDNLDGIEIEKTGNVLNLSFIPDDFELDRMIEECQSSKAFTSFNMNMNKNEIDENAIELSEDVNIAFEIPESFKNNEDDKVLTQPVNKKAKIQENVDDHIQKELEKEDNESIEKDAFLVDLLDDRFKDLYEDEDFVLDASNRKFKLQKSSKDIIEQRNNRYKDTEE